MSSHVNPYYPIKINLSANNFFSFLCVSFPRVKVLPLSVLLHQSQWKHQKQWRYQNPAGWHQRDCLSGLSQLHQTTAATTKVTSCQDRRSSAVAYKDTAGKVPRQAYSASPRIQTIFSPKKKTLQELAQSSQTCSLQQDKNS